MAGLTEVNWNVCFEYDSTIAGEVAGHARRSLID